MTISCTVEPYGHEVEQAYERLFPDNFTAKIAALRWRFAENPHGEGLFAVAREDGNIVGLIGLIATRLAGRRGGQMAYQAIDTVVDPACRGRGLFVAMGNAIEDRIADAGAIIVWGFPNANAAPGWFGRLGWSDFGEVPFRARLLNMKFVTKKLSGGRIGLPLRLARAPVVGEAVDRFGAESAGLCEGFDRRFGRTQRHDPDWLNWRLFDAPGIDYRVRCIMEGGAMVAMVATSLREKHGASICYVMEAMSADPAHDEELTRLLKGELAYRASEGAELALSWCPAHAAHVDALAGAGLRPLPEKLRPIKIHFGGRRYDGAATLDGDDWYLSYLASDTN